MTLKEQAGDFWTDLTVNQKRVVTGITILIVVVVLASWIGAARTYLELRQVRKEKAVAQKDAKEALEAAAKIAGRIRELEKALAVDEAKRNEKSKERDEARDDVDDARADYDRARREPVGRTPSADELCRELTELGYPCR